MKIRNVFALTMLWLTITLFYTITAQQTVDPNINLWPYPQSIVISQSFHTIDSTKFKIVSNTTVKCDLLERAITRYQELAFIQDCSRLGPRGNAPNHKEPRNFASDTNFKGSLATITVAANACEELPHLNMDESYGITIDDKGAQINAPTNWGAIRALETFAQLVRNVGLNQFAVNETAIKDAPRFRYRGLLIDTSRHYIPVRILLDNLDAMAYNKLNVFHWHIVDYQSFPYVSKRFPQLHLKGAYDPETHIYNATDVQTVIEYARERAIRVVVEFDTPGHTISWGKGQPGLLTECYAGEKPNGKYGPIDPTKDANYDFISELFDEVAHTFPDQYLHLGGDEVEFDCWESNPNVKKFMQQKNITTYSKLEDYYMIKAIDIVQKLNRSYIVWEEVFNNGVNIAPDTVVHVWIGSWGDEKEKYWRSELYNVTVKGFNAILSSCWYLDLITYGYDWRTYYECEPISFNGTEAQNKLVIGGEAAMWTELVDGSNLISRIWPRTLAPAERLWSPKYVDNIYNAEDRFDRHRCLMQQRGIRGHPNDGPGFCKCDYAL